jgi:hypothetical protein
MPGAAMVWVFATSEGLIGKTGKVTENKVKI